MAVTYLTTDQLVALHELALEEGGLAGVRSLHALGSAVGQVEQTVFGEDAYPSIAEKAAAYAFFLTAGHPFNDANKRTGALAMEVFLDLNGYQLDQTDEEIEAMLVGWRRTPWSKVPSSAGSSRIPSPALRPRTLAG
jgi:death on curing protein